LEQFANELESGSYAVSGENDGLVNGGEISLSQIKQPLLMNLEVVAGTILARPTKFLIDKGHHLDVLSCFCNPKRLSTSFHSFGIS
jgi:hypothetical protein